jgi:glycosyltransferase involved in cell wall biosynthesis
MKTNCKKVCILSSVHPAFDARIFYKEAKKLVADGYDVTLIAQHTKDEIIDGIKIIALPKPKNRAERFLKLDYLTYKKTLKQKADIYHFHDPELLLWMVRLKKKTGACVIYDVHEDVPSQILSKEYIPRPFKELISIFFKFFEKFFSKNFDFIITSTDAIKDKFVKYNQNVISIKNYISVEHVRNSQIKVRGKMSNFKIIFVGGIYQERGIIEGIQAINLLQDLPIKFVLYGSADDRFLSKLENLDRLKKLEYRGIISYSEVIDKLIEADIGFLCDYPLKRHIEGLPVKLFEYMAAGLPVIASNFSLWKEIVEGNKCGICVNPLKPKEIAKAIEYLIENPEEAKNMGRNGRKAIVEKYNWENEGEKLSEVYKKLLKS